jgi:hypothetical protein
MLSGQPQAVPQLLTSLVSHRTDLRTASLVAPDGRISISSDPTYVGAVPWGRPDRFRATTVVTEPGGDATQYAVLEPVVNAPSCARCHGGGAKVNGWLELRFDRAPVTEAKRELAETLALSAAGALVVLLTIILWLLGSEAVRPVQRLVEAMRRAEAGELTVRADEGRSDELGVAARGFDATLAALRRSQAELEAFYRERLVRADRFAAVGEVATGLAHEIKNPLAGLSGALELLAEDLASNPRHAEVVGEMRHGQRPPTPWRACLLRPPPRRPPTGERHAGRCFSSASRRHAGGVGPTSGGLPPVLADPSAGAGLPQLLPQRGAGHGRPPGPPSARRGRQ